MLNPFPTLIVFNTIRIYGTVASSPRAVTDRLLGCVGTVRMDTNYTKPPGPTPRRSARTLTLGVAQKAWYICTGHDYACRAPSHVRTACGDGFAQVAGEPTLAAACAALGSVALPLARRDASLWCIESAYTWHAHKRTAVPPGEMQAGSL